MKTADVISRAMLKLGILAQGDDMPSEMALSGLNALNDMMAAWQLFGIDRAHTALALTDDFPLDDKFVEGCVYMLAERLQPDAAVPPAFSAKRWMSALQAAYMAIPAQTMPAFRSGWRL